VRPELRFLPLLPCRYGKKFAVQQPPPLPLPLRPRRSYWPGWVAGCLIVLFAVGAACVQFLIFFEVGLFGKAGPNPPIPEEYLGEWRSSGQPVANLQIWPDNRINYHVEKAGKSFDLTGFRALLSSDRKKLIAKFFFLKKEWLINQPPRLGAGQYEMILDGRVYYRVRQFRRAQSAEQMNI
jgi:hypothetical protein